MKALDLRASTSASPRGGGSVPVFREIPGDLLTPVSAFLAFARDASAAFLLESVVGGERLARYSFLGRDPEATLEARGTGVLRARRRRASATERKTLFEAIRERLGPRAAEVPGLPRFTGGAVGYLTYDAVRLFERIPDRHPPSDLPLASFCLLSLARGLRPRRAAAGAHRRRRARPAGAAFDAAQARLDAWRPTCAAGAAAWRPANGAARIAGGLGDGAAYRAAVRTGQGVHRGRATSSRSCCPAQAVVPCDVDPFTVYRALRMVNPSPYMYFLKDGDTAIAGASPEMLVRVENGRVETRPIAGTRPRGETPEDDDAPGRGAPGRRQGARRAPHARGPRAQRPGPGVPLRLGAASPSSCRSSATAT